MREAVDRENHKANVTPRNKDERTTARRGWLENSSPETTGEMSFVNRREFFARGNGTYDVALLQEVLGYNEEASEARRCADTRSDRLKPWRREAGRPRS